MTEPVVTYWDVPYLPKPNRVDVILTEELAPAELTRTAFLVPVHQDSSIRLAKNTRRGLEIPGGHIDPGETMQQAAVRETLEETGCVVTHVRPLGYLRMESDGVVPDDHPYPHPISYQQYFTGLVAAVHDYIPNDECDMPVAVIDLEDPLVPQRQTTIIMGSRAQEWFRESGRRLPPGIENV